MLGTDLPYGPWKSRACDVWDTFEAAAAGDTAALRRLLGGDPHLARAEYWYTRPLHLAVREGRLDAVRLLLHAGGDPGGVQMGDDLVAAARDRGHEDVAALLEEDRAGRGRIPPPAVADGYSAADFEPIDLALWDGPFWGVRGDLETARRLVEGGAKSDLTIAAALGDLEGARALLNEEPARIREARPCGKRPLSSAVEYGHEAIVRLLLERGADPTWPEGTTAPRGVALHAAARAGNRRLVELLLAHGADPNGAIDSSGSPTYAAATPELRALLLAHGGALDPFDLVFLDEDDRAVQLVAADPASASAGCGGVLAAACKLGKRDLVVRLLDAGARVPPVLTECRSYLMTDPETLRLLLASGMDPDLPSWRLATPLHDLCGRDGRGRPRPHRAECAEILLEAGASISARDEEYRSTPLGWAARSDLPEMVDLLLARGAPVSLPDDEAWATPLAWAIRRGHADLAARLRAAGAER